MLNEKATRLQLERERLKAEERTLMGALRPLEDSIDASTFSAMLENFGELAHQSDPEQLQRILRLMVRRVEWGPEGKRSLEYYCPPPKKWARDWFQTNVRSDGPDRIRTGGLLRDRQTC